MKNTKGKKAGEAMEKKMVENKSIVQIRAEFEKYFSPGGWALCDFRLDATGKYINQDMYVAFNDWLTVVEVNDWLSGNKDKSDDGSSGIEKTLEQRGEQYGDFIDNAQTAQALKSYIRQQEKWENLAADQKQAIDVIFDKISRIMSGNPDYADNWHDIAGYATLVEKRLNLKVIK